MSYSEQKFNYNIKETYKDNFILWQRMTNDERRFYNEEPLTTKKALKTFKELFGTRKIKEN
jgi:hypothetical protein